MKRTTFLGADAEALAALAPQRKPWPMPKACPPTPPPFPSAPIKGQLYEPGAPRHHPLDPLLAEAASPQLAQDRDMALHDFISFNSFQPAKLAPGNYDAALGYENGRLTFDLTDQAGAKAFIGLSLTPFRRLFRDYFEIYEAYQNALLGGAAAQVEAIDMARRGLHNELADTLIERLDGKAELDHETARRLATLIAAMFYKKGLI